MNQTSPGKLIIISGPSGAGKSTVVKQLLAECPLPLSTSISATTRKPRDTEQEGVDYFFVSEARFQELRSAGAFLECKQNFGLQHWYGTLHEQVAAGLNAGKWVILEIDVLGAMEILEGGRFDPITIFIHPGGMDQLEKRLRARGTETEESLTARLETAAAEMRYMSRYKYEVINESVPHAVAEICQILQDHTHNHTGPQPCSKN
ncbi:MAG: guanylate kinase [Planctomycetaceae bacterium]